jgi:hypothetical protein
MDNRITVATRVREGDALNLVEVELDNSHDPNAVRVSFEDSKSVMFKERRRLLFQENYSLVNRLQPVQAASGQSIK